MKQLAGTNLKKLFLSCQWFWRWCKALMPAWCVSFILGLLFWTECICGTMSEFFFIYVEGLLCSQVLIQEQLCSVYTQYALCIHFLLTWFIDIYPFPVWAFQPFPWGCTAQGGLSIMIPFLCLLNLQDIHCVFESNNT